MNIELGGNPIIIHLQLNRGVLHGVLSTEFTPAVEINSGARIVLKTLDAGWGMASDLGERVHIYDRRVGLDVGHALYGPIVVKDVKKGMTLAVKINQLIPGCYGYTSAGNFPTWQNRKLGLLDEPRTTIHWELDTENMLGMTTIGTQKFLVGLRPFLGFLGMPPESSGIHSTMPPRYCGGNIDCKELREGSTLYLPISVDGAYLYVGDGHASQGDGEVSSQAIECPMDIVDITISIVEDLNIQMPVANTPNGWITFGFHKNLNEAVIIAIDAMLDFIVKRYEITRVEAMALGSTVVDLRITQIVNGEKGVHAILPHDAIMKAT